MVLKHKIVHEETVNGIIYKIIGEDEIEKALDFYFDVFLKGNEKQTLRFLSDHRLSDRIFSDRTYPDLHSRWFFE